MKVMITGCAGFIGMHTAIQLVKEGHEVVGIDNFNDYYDPRLKEKRRSFLEDTWKVYVTTIDLRLKPTLEAYLIKHEPDLVIHLGAMAGVRYSLEDPASYHTSNIEGTQNLIDACEKVGTENVIYASTSCVMHGHELPWREYDYLYPQINPYGYTKMVNESQFHISKIPNAVGLRFFTVYGPWGRPDMALFDFTKNIVAGNPITLFNNGDMKRDFTYVSDIVDGIMLVKDNMTPRDMYNIGRGEQVELEHFVDAIENALGGNYKAIREYGPKHPADAKETFSDTRKLQALGYAPSVSIQEGVNEFVKWYRLHYMTDGGQ